jgi:hypothetical protein
MDELATLVFPDRITEENGELDFKISQVVVYHSVEQGPPGAHGKRPLYMKYGFAAIVTPEVSIVSSDGKRKCIPIALPDSGMIKMSDLKKRANIAWRLATNQEPRE